MVRSFVSLILASLLCVGCMAPMTTTKGVPQMVDPENPDEQSAPQKRKPLFTPTERKIAIVTGIILTAAGIVGTIVVEPSDDKQISVGLPLMAGPVLFFFGLLAD